MSISEFIKRFIYEGWWGYFVVAIIICFPFAKLWTYLKRNSSYHGFMQKNKWFKVIFNLVLFFVSWFLMICFQKIIDQRHSLEISILKYWLKGGFYFGFGMSLVTLIYTDKKK